MAWTFAAAHCRSSRALRVTSHGHVTAALQSHVTLSSAAREQGRGADLGALVAEVDARCEPVHVVVVDRNDHLVAPACSPIPDLTSTHRIYTTASRRRGVVREDVDAAGPALHVR
eukprot:1862978-Rhodomonas_salina.1